MNLVLLGPPGAGKGTQAQRLSETFGLSHLSSGDLLRSERKKGSGLGQRVAGFMDAGQLVPDDIIVEVILGRLLEGKPGTGYLLDGFPRTLSQAESLDAALAKAGRKVDLVLSLLVPDDVIVSRITGRRICPTCDAVYHLTNRPPAQAGVCDRDKTPLIHRADDTEEVVKQRLTAYHGQTQPLEDYYRRRGNLTEVDGTQDAGDVFAKLRQIMGERRKELGS